MLARIENGKVAELRKITLSDVPPHKRDLWRPVIYEGEGALTQTIVEETQVRIVHSKPPSLPPAQGDYEAAIDNLLEATAKERGYKSEASILSYRASTNPVWAAEARAFASWRDAICLVAYGLLSAVKAGQAEAPTVSQLLGSFLSIKWPAG